MRDEVLEAALNDYVEGTGAQLALVINRAGRILAEAGFADRRSVMQAASLAAGIYASGSRLGELLGDRGMARLHNTGLSRQIILDEIKAPGQPLLMLTVAASDADSVALAAGVEELATALRALPGAEGLGPTGQEDFEMSLMRSLYDIFPSD